MGLYECIAFWVIFKKVTPSASLVFCCVLPYLNLQLGSEATQQKKPRLHRGFFLICLQRRRDSNPRTALTVSGFQDRCNKPLYHSSVCRFFALRSAKIMGNQDSPKLPCHIFSLSAKRCHSAFPLPILRCNHYQSHNQNKAILSSPRSVLSHKPTQGSMN